MFDRWNIGPLFPDFDKDFIYNFGRRLFIFYNCKSKPAKFFRIVIKQLPESPLIAKGYLRL